MEANLPEDTSSEFSILEGNRAFYGDVGMLPIGSVVWANHYRKDKRHHNLPRFFIVQSSLMPVSRPNVVGQWWEFKDEGSDVVAVPHAALHIDPLEGLSGEVDRLFNSPGGDTRARGNRYRRFGNLSMNLARLEELLPDRRNEIDFQKERIEIGRRYLWLCRHTVEEDDEL